MKKNQIEGPTGAKVELSKDQCPVGYWCLYSTTLMTTRFAIYQRPTDKQIENTEKLLGWKWEDAK